MDSAADANEDKSNGGARKWGGETVAITAKGQVTKEICPSQAKASKEKEKKKHFPDEVRRSNIVVRPGGQQFRKPIPMSGGRDESGGHLLRVSDSYAVFNN